MTLYNYYVQYYHFRIQQLVCYYSFYVVVITLLYYNNILPYVAAYIGINDSDPFRGIRVYRRLNLDVRLLLRLRCRQYGTSQGNGEGVVLRQVTCSRLRRRHLGGHNTSIRKIVALYWLMRQMLL